MISFFYNSVSYEGFTPEMAIDSGVPATVVEQAILNGKWSVIRNRRDYLIKQTDWTQVPDTPLSTDKKTEFAVYRQTLRDLPASTDNPDDIVWPEKPTI